MSRSMSEDSSFLFFPALTVTIFFGLTGAVFLGLPGTVFLRLPGTVLFALAGTVFLPVLVVLGVDLKIEDVSLSKISY